MLPRTTSAILFTVVFLLGTSAVMAQFPPGGPGGFPPGGPGGFSRGGPPGGGSRGSWQRTPFGGGRRGGFDGSGGREGRRGGDRSARFERFLRRMDTNGDGVIRENEVPEERRGMIRMMAGRFGLDLSKGISIDKIRQTMSGRRGGGDGGPTPPGSPQQSKPPEEEPLVPGFGSEDEPQLPIGFGVRAKPASRLVFGNEPELDPQARAMFDRVDRNHNGVLEQSEWAGLPGYVRQFDLDGDGKIKIAEVAKFIEQRQQRGQGPGGNWRGRRDRDEEEDEPEDEPNERPSGSYRFRTAGERLPQGLPDWFTSRDADGDGQVAMAEYSRYWTRSTIAEFRGRDTDGDGVITAEECLNPGTGGGGPASPTARPAPPSGGPAAPAPAPKKEVPWWLR